MEDSGVSSNEMPSRQYSVAVLSHVKGGVSVDARTLSEMPGAETVEDEASPRPKSAPRFSKYAADQIDPVSPSEHSQPRPTDAFSRHSYESNQRRVVGSYSFLIGDDTALFLKYRNYTADFIARNRFKNFIGVVIVLNAVTIGLESSARVQGWHTALDVLSVLEHIFLSVYVVELGLRFFAFGWRCIFDNWVKFDSVLVAAGVTTNWILPLVDDGFNGLGFLLALRLLRLLRLARTLRLIASVRDLWLLVKSLLDSTGTMTYTIGLLGMVLYIFACMGMELITLSPAARGPDADPDFQRLVDEYFSTIGMTMLTLVQFVSFDSISNIYRPFIENDPSPPLLTIYFVLVFVVIGIVLMNLITAVVVNSALDQAGQDKEVMRLHEEKEKKKMISALRKIFWRLDTDGSGTISSEELKAMTHEDRKTMFGKCGDYDPLELFAAVDVDGSTVLDIDVFCDSIWQVSHSQVPLEVKRTEKQVLRVSRQLQELTRRVAELQGSVAVVVDAMLSAPAATGSERHVAFEPASREASALPSPAAGIFWEPSGRWVQELSLKIQAGVAQQIRLEIDRGSVRRGASASATDAEGYAIPLENGGVEPFPGDTPAWAHLLLQELQQLRRECLVSSGGGGSCIRSAARSETVTRAAMPLAQGNQFVQGLSPGPEALGSASCLGRWHCATAEGDRFEAPPDMSPALFGGRSLSRRSATSVTPPEDPPGIGSKVGPTAGRMGV